MEKKMHIAMSIGSLTKGGAERVMVNLAEYFASKGHQVTIVTQYRRENEYTISPQIKRVISDIEGEEISGSRLVNFKRRFLKLRRIWKEEKPDLILSFIGKNNMMAILTSAGLSIPVAVSVRGEPGEEYYNNFLRLGAKVLFGFADGVILQTRRCFDFFPKRVKKRAVILHNPVSSTFFRERYEGEREKTIVAVGRVDGNKNHEMLIRAFAEIAGEFPGYQVIIYGEGPERERLLKLVDEVGMTGKISLPGSIDNVSDAIYKSEIFVLTSNTEGVPNTLIEAMLMGLCALSTDCPCGGPADLIRHGENGLLFPVGDTLALKEQLRLVLTDKDFAERLGKNATEIKEVFATDKVYGEWESYFNKLCDK